MTTTLTGCLDSKGPWIVTLRKYQSTWHYFTTNPSGGGFGSNYCGPKRIALHRAMRGIPRGEQVTVETYHERRIISNERMVKG